MPITCEAHGLGCPPRSSQRKPGGFGVHSINLWSSGVLHQNTTRHLKNVDLYVNKLWTYNLSCKLYKGNLNFKPEIFKSFQSSPFFAAFSPVVSLSLSWHIPSFASWPEPIPHGRCIQQWTRDVRWSTPHLHLASRKVDGIIHVEALQKNGSFLPRKYMAIQFLCVFF